MKRPDTVTVLGQPFTVEYVTTGAVTLALEGHAMGRTNVSDLQLLINDDQHEVQLRDTVLHEVIHACIHLVESRADDEKYVERLAPVLLDVLRSNPVLVKWLTE